MLNKAPYRDEMEPYCDGAGGGGARVVADATANVSDG